VWDEEHQRAFNSLKRALCEAPWLQIPHFARDFVLLTNASDLAISAVLHQEVNGALAPISYYSRLLTAAERKYSTYEKECLAVLFGCERCRSFLEHKEFELHCDNLALCWLLLQAQTPDHLKLPLTFRAVQEPIAKQWFSSTYDKLNSYNEFRKGFTDLL
jgi:hypothetical protein